MANQKYEIGKEMFLNGGSITQISKQLRISAAWFGYYLKEQGIDTRPNATKIEFDRDYFSVIDCEAKAYWLGFIAADGCIVEQYKRGKLKAMVMELTVCEEDKDHLSKLCEAIQLDAGNIKKKIVTVNDKQHVAYKICLCSTSLCRDLVRHGVTPRKSLSIEISPEILNSRHLRHFIRGFFDGNGSIFKNGKTVMFSSASAKMIEQLDSIFHKLGCKHSTVYSNFSVSKGLGISYSGSSGYAIITKYMYENSTIYLTRKHDIYVAHLCSNA